MSSRTGTGFSRLAAIFQIVSVGWTLITIPTAKIESQAMTYIPGRVYWSPCSQSHIWAKYGNLHLPSLELDAKRGIPPGHPDGCTNPKHLLEILYRLRANATHPIPDRSVFTNGIFDLFHEGHVEVLRACRSAGSLVIVGINTDESTRRLKGPGRPVCSLRTRMAALLCCAYVDCVIPFDEPDPEDLIRLVRPDILVKGDDGAEPIGAKFVLANFGEVLKVKKLPGISTTNILSGGKL